ncbi:FA20C protein, partial [Acromyrmex charruanus]
MKGASIPLSNVGIAWPTYRKNSTTLEKFHFQISRLQLYSEDSKYVDQLLHEMATKPILHVVQKDGGTQLKLVIDYGNNMQALFKPMRRVAKEIRRQRRASERQSPWSMAGNSSCDLVTSSHTDEIANWRD